MVTRKEGGGCPFLLIAKCFRSFAQVSGNASGRGSDQTNEEDTTCLSIINIIYEIGVMSQLCVLFPQGLMARALYCTET